MKPSGLLIGKLTLRAGVALGVFASAVGIRSCIATDNANELKIKTDATKLFKQRLAQGIPGLSQSQLDVISTSLPPGATPSNDTCISEYCLFLPNGGYLAIDYDELHAYYIEPAAVRAMKEAQLDPGLPESDAITGADGIGQVRGQNGFVTYNRTGRIIKRDDYTASARIGIAQRGLELV